MTKKAPKPTALGTPEMLLQLLLLLRARFRFCFACRTKCQPNQVESRASTPTRQSSVSAPSSSSSKPSSLRSQASKSSTLPSPLKRYQYLLSDVCHTLILDISSPISSGDTHEETSFPNLYFSCIPTGFYAANATVINAGTAFAAIEAIACDLYLNSLPVWLNTRPFTVQMLSALNAFLVDLI
ncbi:hypothetical protein BDP27DRAFT_1415708 [Rhodocollybia butyracea]|uniref:Uncharacterized protein n=1 Tax=Rhodocollybia butyracea TaxID=206335 RepID=A0A9P5UE04_9AGAR|nr:hypothetical protein BDP27DRAFT_1415708 [Rhodocollybia butyracea]